MTADIHSADSSKVACVTCKGEGSTYSGEFYDKRFGQNGIYYSEVVVPVRTRCDTCNGLGYELITEETIYE